MEEDAEVNLDRVEEEMAGEYSDEEEDDILHIDDYAAKFQKDRDGLLSAESERFKPDDIMESNTDTEIWKLEVFCGE